MPEKDKGLFEKYYVHRRDGKALTGPAFVLEYGRDPFAYFALRAYMNALHSHPQFQHLAVDLLNIVTRIEGEGLDCRLDCPACGTKHVDDPKIDRHTLHRCQVPTCAYNWKPFPFPTRGIAF